jgi:HAMP domain-containing protein
MPAEQHPQGRFFSLRLKIWLGFVLIFTPVFVASYYWFYQYTSQSVLQNISENLGNTIEGAVKEMDVDNFVALYQEESASNPNCPPALDAQENGYYPENPRYLAHVNWLRTVQSIEPNTRIYTYIKGPEPQEIIAIGSTGYFRTPRGGFKFCERYTSKTTRIYEGLSYRVDVRKVYTDKYGSWITTYMPIANKDGQIVGAIGVDLAADYVNKVKNDILRSGAIAFVLSYLAIFFLIYYASGVVTRPLIRLTSVAEQIGLGNYKQEFPAGNAKIKDEIDTLTDVFRVMVEKVYQRERSLRERVQQLEIMIDESKRARSVQEIVESDFFQELQAKVKTIRERYHSEGGKDKA